MRTRTPTIVAMGLAATVTLSAQSTMKQIRLTEGADDNNRLTTPVYNSTGMAPLTLGAFTAGFDKKGLIVRRGGGNMFTRGPEYKLDPTVDVAALFTESMATQAAAMGLNVSKGAAPGWKVAGTIRDVYVESRQIPYGATLFYGYMDVQLQIENPTGGTATPTMRAHNYYGAYNAGMGRKDEAESAVAHLLVEGAQEILARLNREFFKAAPHAGIAAQLANIRAGSIDKNLNALRAVSLSGLPAATPALLAILPTETSESGRSALIDALATLGSPDVISVLSGRYATEDEDCRWYTLKAMDYIGGDAAMKVVTTSGVADKDVGPKRLAQRITSNK